MIKATLVFGPCENGKTRLCRAEASRHTQEVRRVLVLGGAKTDYEYAELLSTDMDKITRYRSFRDLLSAAQNLPHEGKVLVIIDEPVTISDFDMEKISDLWTLLKDGWAWIATQVKGVSEMLELPANSKTIRLEAK